MGRHLPDDDAIREVREALIAFREAELRGADPAATWQAVAEAVGRSPGRDAWLGARVWAAAGAWAHPALAATLATLVLGLGAGAWLGLAAQRGPAAAGVALPYDDTSLLEGSSASLEARYFSASAGENSGVDSAGAPAARGGELR